MGKRKNRKRGKRKSGNRSDVNAMMNSPWRESYSVRFPGTGFPDKLRLKMKYVETVSFSGSVSPAAQVWCPNSIYQVDATGTTGNPNFYNALKGIYSRYVVVGVEGTVEVVNTVSGTLTPFTWAFGLSDNNTGSKTVLQITEQRYALSGHVITSAAPALVTRKFPYISMSQIQGQKDITDDPNMYAGVTANPVDQIWGVFRAASDSATSISGYVRLILTQDVVFKDILDVVT